MEKNYFWVYANHPPVHSGGSVAGRGSVAVAVGVSDRWQVTHDTQHMTHDMWHVTYNTWNTHIFMVFYRSPPVRFCPFLSISVCFSLFLSIFVSFCPFLYDYFSCCTFLSVFVGFCMFRDFFGIGVIIRTRGKIQFLPYAWFCFVSVLLTFPTWRH